MFLETMLEADEKTKHFCIWTNLLVLKWLTNKILKNFKIKHSGKDFLKIRFVKNTITGKKILCKS